MGNTILTEGKRQQIINACDFNVDSIINNCELYANAKTKEADNMRRASDNFEKLSKLGNTI